MAPSWLIAPSTGQIKAAAAKGRASFAQRPAEKLVEALVAGDVRVRGFAHVDAVSAHEPADQPGRHRAMLRASDAPGEGGQTPLWQQVLQQDFQAIGHREPRKQWILLTWTKPQGEAAFSGLGPSSLLEKVFPGLARSHRFATGREGFGAVYLKGKQAAKVVLSWGSSGMNSIVIRRAALSLRHKRS
jgi:hypothetical protein